MKLISKKYGSIPHLLGSRPGEHDKFITEGQHLIATRSPLPPPPEGVVYRVERKGKVDFLAKYVCSEFQPGIYLPNVTGQAPIWNKITI